MMLSKRLWFWWVIFWHADVRSACLRLADWIGMRTAHGPLEALGTKLYLLLIPDDDDEREHQKRRAAQGEGREVSDGNLS